MSNQERQYAINSQIQALGLAPFQPEMFAKSATATGYVNGVTQQYDGAALREQNIDPMITRLTYSTKELQLLSMLKADASAPTTSTVVNYLQLTDYGETGGSRAVGEGQFASQNDFSMEPKTARVKFVSDARAVTFQAQAVNSYEDPIAVQQEAALNVVAKTIEGFILYGDASLTDKVGDAELGGLQFDGLTKLIPQDQTIDLRGKNIDLNALTNAATDISIDERAQFQAPTHVIMPVKVFTQFMNAYSDKALPIQTGGGELSLGYGVKSFELATGQPVSIVPHALMNRDKELREPRNHYKVIPAPEQITATVNSKAIPADAVEQFAQADVDHGFKYRVRVVSEGQTRRVEADVPSTAVTAYAETDTIKLADVKDSVSVSVTIPAGFAVRPSYVEVYRSGHGRNSDRFFLVGKVAGTKAQVSGGTKVFTFTDTNLDMPDTSDVFMGKLTREAITLFELQGVTRYNLALTTAANQFALLWMGCLALKQPYSWVRFKNVNHNQA